MALFASVITSINPPSPGIRRWRKAVQDLYGSIVIIGDRKTKGAWSEFGGFLSLKRQKMFFPLGEKIPENSYSRKNVGYLMAIAQQSPCIHETDDDNRPLPNFAIREETLKSKGIAPSSWANVYKIWTNKEDTAIWPRGFPLGNITDPRPKTTGTRENTCPIQQGIVQNDPDVDAIWRLTNKKKVEFLPNPNALSLPPGTWCPFNSQNTWWWPTAYPLLYLPSFCTMRCTDIWRSYVALRCLEALQAPLGFFAADFVQHRNKHNIYRDFLEEIPTYQNTSKIRSILENTPLKENTEENLLLCYESLIREKILPKEELALVQLWIKSLHEVV